MPVSLDQKGASSGVGAFTGRGAILEARWQEGRYGYQVGLRIQPLLPGVLAIDDSVNFRLEWYGLGKWKPTMTEPELVTLESGRELVQSKEVTADTAWMDNCNFEHLQNSIRDTSFTVPAGLDLTVFEGHGFIWESFTPPRERREGDEFEGTPGPISVVTEYLGPVPLGAIATTTATATPASAEVTEDALLDLVEKIVDKAGENGIGFRDLYVTTKQSDATLGRAAVRTAVGQLEADGDVVKMDNGNYRMKIPF